MRRRVNHAVFYANDNEMVRLARRLVELDLVVCRESRRIELASSMLSDSLGERTRVMKLLADETGVLGD